MSLAQLDRSASVGSRITWAVLLCAVAVGIVGMHGLVSGADFPESAGHHVTQAIDLAPEAAGSHAATQDAGPVGDEGPTHESGLLALCLMVLVPAVAVGLLLLARSRVGVRHLRRLPARAVLATDVAVPPPPFRRLTVLRI
jgi:hypothetical protein